MLSQFRTNNNCNFSLLGINVDFKHLRSYRDGGFLYQWSFDHCAATQECYAADTGHDAPPRHSIQTRVRTVVVISINVERYTGMHNYRGFNFLGQIRSGNPSPTYQTHQ